MLSTEKFPHFKKNKVDSRYKETKDAIAHINSLLESPLGSTKPLLFRIGVKESTIHPSAPFHANTTKT